MVVRWTIGEVSPFGFEALRLSLHGAWRLFGRTARYVVCVNTTPVEEACRRVGRLPVAVEWRPVSREALPAFLRPHFDEQLAEGVGWKFMPLRIDAQEPELALDNDCILWSLPDALLQWLEGASAPVLAEDVRACFGQFQDLCGDAPRNSGIRALPAGFDLEQQLRAMLRHRPVRMTSELDEQGLQVAALSRTQPPLIVRLDEVSICSPFHPHRPTLGSCGAHFVGLNAHALPWRYYDRPATDCLREHWLHYRDELAARVGA